MVGKYMAAVRRFLETNDVTLLEPFEGRSVVDSRGQEHPFETRPNAVYRLAHTEDHSFEEIYRIVLN